MSQAKSGDTVKVHYTGKFEDGAVFDSSRERDPLQFVLGAGQIIPGVEKAVEGMAPGESKTTTIPADEAYGQRRDDLVFSLDRNQLAGDAAPQVGQQVQLQQPDGKSTRCAVVGVTDSAVTLDANHPLAGHDLTFDLELVEVG